MKNKKGFTLVELLAVIVLIGLLSSVTVTAIVRTRRKANEKLVMSLATSLKSIGGEVYAYEILKGDKTNEDGFYKKFKETSNSGTFVVSLAQLKRAGYLKNVKDGKFISPVNSSQKCPGYLLVKKVGDAPKFEGYVNCPGLPAATTDKNGAYISAEADDKTVVLTCEDCEPAESETNSETTE